jgi:hypothetical protein
MSRIVLTRYESNQERVVVGWDHPCGGAFWQEFAEDPADGSFPDDFEEVIREGGLLPGLPLPLGPQVPEDLRPLVTPEVEALLARHAEDPDSDYRTNPIDLSAAERPIMRNLAEDLR